MHTFDTKEGDFQMRMKMKSLVDHSDDDNDVGGQQTALLQRRPMAVRWEKWRWTVGLRWDRGSATLTIYPVPCAGVYVHLPGRNTRTGVTRWLRAQAIVFTVCVAVLMATAFGFVAGRLFPAPAVGVGSGSAVEVDVRPPVTRTQPIASARERLAEPATKPNQEGGVK